MNSEHKDYYGIEINIGDTVTFPARTGFMDGVVEKLSQRITGECFVRNERGNTKWKECRYVINRSKISLSSPELFV